MTTTDTNVQNLVINKLTSAQYSTITPSSTELYMVTDEAITSSDVITALGYTLYSSSNPNGYISGIISSDVTTALGYTPAESAEVYIYEQSVASDTWVINHNLDTKPSIIIVDSASTVIIPDEIVYTDNNTTTITFLSEFSGKAYLNYTR